MIRFLLHTGWAWFCLVTLIVVCVDYRHHIPLPHMTVGFLYGSPYVTILSIRGIRDLMPRSTEPRPTIEGVQ